MKHTKHIRALALALVMVCGLLPTVASAATVTQVVPYKYSEVYDFSEGLAVVHSENGWGAIDATGKEVIPCGVLKGYEYLDTSFHDGYLAVAQTANPSESWCDFLVGYVDVTGQEVIPCAYATRYSRWDGWSFTDVAKPVRFHNGVAVRRNTVIDKSGNEIVPNGKYNRISPFSEGLAAVCVGNYPDEKWGFIDTTGKEVIPCQYQSAGDFANGKAVVTGSTGQIQNGKTVYAEGVIDTQGNIVVPFGQYKAPDGKYHDGLKAVQAKDGKWGFVDQAGNQIIPAKYDTPRYMSSYSYTPSFSNGLAAVYLSDKGYGYIDLHGNEVLPFQYGEARQLSEGMLAVGVDDKWGFVRVEGLPTTPGAPIVEPEKPTVPDTSKDFEINPDGKLTKYKGPGGNVVIPSNVTSIGSFAFEKYANPINVSIPDSVTSIGHSAFYQCPGLTGVTIGNGVTRIENMAFHGCANLTSVTIPKSVTTIGQQAFFECNSLKSVIIPDSVTTLEMNAFRGCTSLADVTIGKGVTTIEQATFSGCTSLTNVNIPDGVTTLGLYAFMDCTSLTSITIPGSVTKIDYAAFRRSTGLTDIYYGGSEAQWKAITIESSNDPLLSATIHYNSAAPAQPVQPAPATTAYASTQTVTVDGKPVTFYAYALKEGNGMTNYIKLRDVAQILNGSAAQFQVGYDGSITITTKTAYTPNGSEMVQNFTGDQSYTVSTSPVTVNGQPTNLEAITLTDANGGGYTYFKLRDLGAALGFNVSWSADTGISIDPNSPYNANS